MSGIAGIINWEEDLSLQGNVLVEMLKTLEARGPDAQGTYIATHALLGHRKLGGDVPQPLLKECGGEKFILTYNGRIYNITELRTELNARAHNFAANSDAEVLLSAYMEWGEDFLDRLDGVFALAIWNETRETFFMARDRLGVKPLFYAKRGANLIFGSELKSLLAHPSVEAKIDYEGLAEIFMMGPARTPGHGVFKNLYELKPGHCFSHERNKSVIKQYWSFKSQEHRDDFKTTTEKVRELFTAAVNRQLKSDAPLCCLLSGGLDSSLITGLAAAIYRGNGLGQLNTYSVNYVDYDKFFRANSFQFSADEPWARVMSEHFQTNHHSVMLDTPELVSNLTNAVLARDLPGMADVDSSLYIFCREIRKDAQVVLSGECADEYEHTC